MATTKTFDLSYSSIDAICKEIVEFCNKTKVPDKDCLRLRLLAEETLLQYRDFASEDTHVDLVLNKSMFKTKIALHIFCDSYNPFVAEDDGLMKSLSSMNSSNNHSWKYDKGIYAQLINGERRNIIDFVINRDNKINNPLMILLCLAIGAVLALILKAIVPAEDLAVICIDYIQPLGNAYTGLLCVMAILLIFFSIPLAMVQYGNGSAFQKDLGHILRKFIIIPVVLVLVTFLIAIISFGMNSETIEFGSVIKPIFDVFIGFIPGNLVNPFSTFNCMQVLIIGALFGFAFLIMEESARSLVNAFDKLNLVAVITNGYLARFVGIYSGLMIFYYIASETGNAVEVIWIVAVTLAVSVIAYLMIAMIVSIKLKVRLGIVIKKYLPSFLINLSSASIGASYAVFFDELFKDSGVEVNYTGVTCNLGTVLFKPIYSVFFAATGFLIAAECGDLSWSMAVQIMILSLVLPMAIPNIPGGASPIIVILLSSLGFAEAYNDTIISINSLLQFFIVPFNIFLLQCIIVLLANTHGKIDLNRMRKDT